MQRRIGLDYAQNRYYTSTLGRFNTPDPFLASGGPASPASWNRYVYTRGDPINRVDPGGLADWEVTVTGSIGEGGIGGFGGGGSPLPDQPVDFGPGGGGNAYITPSVAPGPNNTPAQLLAVFKGFNDAFDRVESVDCGGYFDGGAPEFLGEVTGTLVNTTYRLLPLSAGVGAQTIDSSNVFINTAGAFFAAGADPNGNVHVTLPDASGKPTAATFANLSTLEGFILLHELGHQAGLYGPDTDGPTNGANSQGILSHCFGQDAQGVYH